MKKDEALKLALEYLKLQKIYGPAIGFANTTVDDVIAKIKTALAQPEQEPAAEVACDTNPNSLHIKFLPAGKDLSLGDKLYTSPPQRIWAWLTTEEIQHIGATYTDEPWGGDGWSVDFANAVTNKLKEKNT